MCGKVASQNICGWFKMRGWPVGSGRLPAMTGSLLFAEVGSTARSFWERSYVGSWRKMCGRRRWPASLDIGPYSLFRKDYKSHPKERKRCMQKKKKKKNGVGQLVPSHYHHHHFQ